MSAGPSAVHAAAAVRTKKRAEASGKSTMTIGIAIGTAGLVLFMINLLVFAGKPNSTVASNDGGEKKPATKTESPAVSTTPNSPPVTRTDEPKASGPNFLEKPKNDPMVTKPAATPGITPDTAPKPEPFKPQPATTPAENATNGKWESQVFELGARTLSLGFSPDAKWLVCGCAEGQLKLIDIETRKTFKLDGHAERISGVAFSPNGKWIASGCWDKTVKIWDLETKTCTQTLKGHTSWVWAVAFSADSSTLVSGSFDKSIRFWNVENGESRKFDPHVSEVLTLDCSRAGTLLLTAGTGLQVHVWDFSNDAEKCKFYVKGVVHSAVFSPDMKRIGLGFEQEKTVGVWDINGKQQALLHGHSDFVHCVCFIDNNTIVSASKDKMVKLWDINGSKEIVNLSGHMGPVNAVAYCASRKLLVSGSNDGKLRFWTNAAFFEALGK